MSILLIRSLKSFYLMQRRSMLAANVLALGAVADFGAQNCQYTTKVDGR